MRALTARIVLLPERGKEKKLFPHVGSEPRTVAARITYKIILLSVFFKSIRQTVNATGREFVVLSIYDMFILT